MNDELQNLAEKIKEKYPGSLSFEIDIVKEHKKSFDLYAEDYNKKSSKITVTAQFQIIRDGLIEKNHRLRKESNSMVEEARKILQDSDNENVIDQEFKAQKLLLHAMDNYFASQRIKSKAVALEIMLERIHINDYPDKLELFDDSQSEKVEEYYKQLDKKPNVHWHRMPEILEKVDECLAKYPTFSENKCLGYAAEWYLKEYENETVPSNIKYHRDKREKE